jgi:hypothetical protein
MACSPSTPTPDHPTGAGVLLPGLTLQPPTVARASSSSVSAAPSSAAAAACTSAQASGPATFQVDLFSGGGAAGGAGSRAPTACLLAHRHGSFHAGTEYAHACRQLLPRVHIRPPPSGCAPRLYLLQITAGAAEVALNAKGKTKTFGAPLGVWIDILPAGTAAGAAADAACHVKVAGAIKAGATRARKVPTKKLTACFAALRLADCSQPLQARAQAVAGTKYKEGPWSDYVSFTPSCMACRR